MFLEAAWKQLVRDFRNVTFVVADGLPVQLNLLSQNYAHGLVAQLPYEMGVKSVDTLLALRQYMEGNGPSANVPTELFPDLQGTNVLEHLQIPLVLPELSVDQNYLGKLSIIGFTLFGVIFVTALGFAIWAWANRELGVVKMAQPGFLVMVALGSMVMGSTIVPLSFDDSGGSYNEERGIAICMSIPWLAFLGFTITFSALIAKTWRVNQLFRNSGQFQRVQVTAGQVAKPFFLLFAANALVLTLWSVLDPLHFVRLDMPGTDGWNRVLSTYGSCRSENATPYIAVLAALNLLVLGKANWQAYQARDIKSEFSEAHYIGVTMASMLQATLIGVPLLILVRDMPQAFYLTLAFMLFTITMVILLLIFVPKVANTKLFRRRSQKSQRRLIQESIASSARNKGASVWSTNEESKHEVQAKPAAGVASANANDGSLRFRQKADLANTSVHDFMVAAKQQAREDKEARVLSHRSSGSSDSLDFDSAFEDDGAKKDTWRESLDLAKGIQSLSNGNVSQRQMRNSSSTALVFDSSESLTCKQAPYIAVEDRPPEDFEECGHDGPQESQRTLREAGHTAT